MEIFDTLLVHPLLNLLIFFYNLPFVDLGIAIILLTILVKLLLYPLNLKSIKFQKKFQGVQVKMREIQEKYKGNAEVSSQKILELFKKEKVNPFMGILPILIQFPIMLAIFFLLQDGIDAYTLAHLYDFVYNPGEVNPYFLGLIPLTKPNLILAIFTGMAQFIFSKVNLALTNSGSKEDKVKKGENFIKLLQKQMIYILPIITFFILLTLPAALAVYWTTNTILSIIQHLYTRPL